MKVERHFRVAENSPTKYGVLRDTVLKDILQKETFVIKETEAFGKSTKV